MVKKIQIGKRISLSLSNRWLYTFIAIGIIISLGMVVYAWANPTTGVGHSYDEIQPCTEGKILQIVGGSWTCVDISSTLPIGTVIMYDGTGIADAGTRTEDIGNRAGDTISMPGWKVANGQSGTPNLLNKFVRAESISGNTDGEDTHTLTIAEMPAHGHSFRYWQGTTGAGSQYAAGSLYPPHTTYDYTATASVINKGGGQPHENRPAYYSLIFIKRVN